MNSPPPSVVSSPARLFALSQAKLLDTQNEPCFDRITALSKAIFGCDVALFSVVDVDRQVFKSECGLPAPYSETRQTPLSHSFCKHVVELSAPLVVEDARLHPLVSDNLAIRDLDVIAYLGAPVRAPSGDVLGSLCVISTTPRAWSDDEISRLNELALLTEDIIALRSDAKSAAQLAQENDILAREYHHRVKNALAVSAALVKASAKEATSAQDLAVKASERLVALATAHDTLLAKSDDVDLAELATKLLRPYYLPGTTTDVEGPPVRLSRRQVTPICLLLHELATNSAKYGAFRSFGHVKLSWAIIADGKIKLEWVEQSATRPVTAAAGFGGQLLQMSAAQLGGELRTNWNDDSLHVTLDFPAE